MSGVLSWRNAVAATYGASGVAFASWVSRIPAIRDDLALSPGSVGILLMCMTVGAFASVSASGLIVLRLGPRRTTRVGALMFAVGVCLAGVGATVLGQAGVVGAGLAIIGLGTASWNTASNVEGAAVERALGRHIMPRLHGSFSLGTVLGAGLGAGAAAIHLPVLWHFAAAAAVVLASVWIAAGYYQSERTTAGPELVDTVADLNADPATGPIPLVDSPLVDGPVPTLDGKARIKAAWRDKRTLLLGVLVLGLSLAEGAAGDWVALAMADGYGSTNAIGALGYGLFVSAMTLGRFAGTVLLDRYGRVAVLRFCAGTAIAGLALFVFAPNQWVALGALVLWGLGSSLGFPVGMSAASDDPENAAARVSVVSTIGYGAFLCGPPLLGLLAEHVGVLHSLLAVLVMLAVGFILTPYVHHPRTPAASVPQDADR
ncbi:MFS transporter [Pseudarthrobacter sp. P1]|uniref:MFS transporter n=1 Tax=Pseudarthrobacter sp. P1 TaxID=3418418 RepID=UPI003CECFFAF